MRPFDPNHKPNPNHKPDPRNSEIDVSAAIQGNLQRNGLMAAPDEDYMSECGMITLKGRHTDTRGPHMRRKRINRHPCRGR